MYIYIYADRSVACQREQVPILPYIILYKPLNYINYIYILQFYINGLTVAYTILNEKYII